MTDNQGRPKLDQAIEHILSDYKRVLKENEEKSIILLAGAEKVKQLEKENEELQKELKKKVGELTDEQGYWGGSDLLEQVEVLQELLEEKK